jgi:hypothetical protein
MIEGRKALCIVLSVGFLLVGSAILYFLGHKALALPFRQANDMLHEMDFPLTLDFLIPGGFYIDKKTSIGEVVQRRFQKSGDRLTLLLTKISERVPARYRYGGAALLYVFWTFLFLIFFRLFTWMAYAPALRTSFLCGAIVYFFVPDLIVGRLDDTVFVVWPIALFVTARWFRRPKGEKSSQR